MAGKPYDRIVWRGHVLNRRTAALLEWAEKDSGVGIQLAQGSYRGGNGAAASGSTHDAGGAADIRTSILTEKQRKRLVRSLKRAGGAVWFRPTVPGLWGQHLHLIAIGDREASSSAKWQVGEYLAGRSGLTSRGQDRTYRPRPAVRFSFKRGKPVPL